MTTNITIEIANRINTIDARCNAFADGGCIKGSFRGKTSEKYCYMISTKTFTYNNAGYNVEKAINEAIAECSTKKLTKAEIFKAAHKLAHTFEGNYKACFALALKQVYASQK